MRSMLRRRLFGLAAFAVAAAIAAPVLTAAYFVAGIEDLPLMPGLTQVPDSAVVFDKPGGRIVAVEATGAVSQGAVSDFYRATLPQLGWRETAPGRFERDDEVLRLEFTRRGGIQSVRFSLAPD